MHIIFCFIFVLFFLLKVFENRKWKEEKVLENETERKLRGLKSVFRIIHIKLHLLLQLWILSIYHSIHLSTEKKLSLKTQKKTHNGLNNKTKMILFVFKIIYEANKVVV